MKIFSSRRIFVFLGILFLVSACFSRRQDFRTRILEENLPTETNATPLAGVQETPLPTLQPTSTIVPTFEALPTSLPRVTITATGGNLFIRRGPGLAYDAEGILYKDTSAEIIGRDVLSGWVQVNISDSQATGWISIQTQFSKIDGDLTIIQAFTFEEWPEPAYIKNCTEHDMFIEPAGLYLASLYSNATGENEVQVNPGDYIIYDLFVQGEPEVERVSVREGNMVYVTINGLGVGHKCP